jgi:hypothetical protein
VSEAVGRYAAKWEVEIRDFDHLLELLEHGTIGFRPREDGSILVMVDDPGKRFQQC